MKLRQLVKDSLPPIVVKALKRIRNYTMLQFYPHHKTIPWSSGYNTYKRTLIMRTLSDKSLLSTFRFGDPLPPGYGVGIDERCIEYPWLVAQLDDGPELLLDAGSTLNHDIILEHPVFRQKTIHILTLSPEAN